MDNKKVPKIFYCIYCDYSTSKKSSYNNHVLSAKHQKSIIGDALVTKLCPKLCSTNYTCEKCNKVYESRNGLWKHSKNCLNENHKTFSQ